MTAEFILLIIGAYLLGSFPSAYLAMKWYRGIDIRQKGTGKVGAANVLVSGTKWLAVVVAIFDIGKAVLAVWISQLLGMSAAQQITVGIFAIIGHNWPVFLHFRGGRGVFTTFGVIMMFSPKLGLIVLVASYLFAPVRQVAFGVFLALVSLPILSWFLSKPMGIEDRLPITMGFIALASIGLSKRLFAPRTALSRTVPMHELLFYRLLFDRDIADRKAWINRDCSGEDSTGHEPEQQEEKV